MRPLATRRTAAGEGRAHAEAGGEEEEAEGGAGVQAALAALRLYKRAISPLLPASCRFVPTCSAYAAASYREFGVAKGTVLTAWRLARCNPFGGSGFDPPAWPPPGLLFVPREVRDSTDAVARVVPVSEVAAAYGVLVFAPFAVAEVALLVRDVVAAS